MDIFTARVGLFNSTVCNIKKYITVNDEFHLALKLKTTRTCRLASNVNSESDERSLTVGFAISFAVDVSVSSFSFDIMNKLILSGRLAK